MPRGGENHAQGGEKSLRGGKKISRALRARRTVYFFPPLGNFSCTPLLPTKQKKSAKTIKTSFLFFLPFPMASVRLSVDCIRNLIA